MQLDADSLNREIALAQEMRTRSAGKFDINIEDINIKIVNENCDFFSSHMELSLEESELQLEEEKVT